MFTELELVLTKAEVLQANGMNGQISHTLLQKTNGDLYLTELNYDKSFMGKMFCLIGHRFEVLTQESRKRTTSIINFRLFCFALPVEGQRYCFARNISSG